MASPQAVFFRQQLAAFTAQAVGKSLPEMRAMFVAFAEGILPPEGVTYTAADADGMSALWAVPQAARTDRTVVYIHGGAYVLGSAHACRYFAGHFAKLTGCPVLAVDYRLAPEHPFPAAITDVQAAYRWVLAQGRAAAQVALVGDSAGGGLMLALLLALRDAGVPLPCAAVAISPWADLEVTGESMRTNAELDVMCQAPAVQGMAAMVLAGQNPRQPPASPIHGDYTGLPPLLIQVGSHETLLDDSRRVARAAEKAGVDVTLEVFPEMQHVFQQGVGRVPEADDAMARIGAFLRARLGV